MTMMHESGSVEKEMKVKAWDGSSGGGEGLRQMERIANTTTADTLMGAVMMIRIKMIMVMMMVDESLWLTKKIQKPDLFWSPPAGCFNNYFLAFVIFMGLDCIGLYIWLSSDSFPCLFFFFFSLYWYLWVGAEKWSLNNIKSDSSASPLLVWRYGHMLW